MSITLDHNPLADLKLWLLNTHSANGSPITPPAPTLFITTAVSKTGWCAVCQAHGKKRALVGRRNQTSYKRIRTQGCLLGPKGLPKESVSPRGLPENAQHHSNSPNKQQGRCRYRYRWCLDRNIVLSAQHVPGGLKTIVDSESRVFNDNSECKINRQVISPFLKECDIDVDALTMNWEPFKGYAFPPFSAKHSNGGRSPEPSDRATSPHPDHQTPFEGSIRPSKDSPNVSQTAPCSVSHLRRQYQAMGISEDFTKILFSASRPSTRKTYRSAWGRWSC